MGISKTYDKAGAVIPRVLEHELTVAAIPVVGVAYNSKEAWVRVDFADSALQSEIDATQAIVDAHTGTDSQRVTLAQLKQLADAINLDTSAPATLAQAATDIVRLKRIVLYLLAKDRL